MSISELFNGLKSSDFETRTSCAISLTKLLNEYKSNNAEEVSISTTKFIKTIRKELLPPDNLKDKKARKNHYVAVLLSLSIMIKSNRTCDISEDDSNFREILTYLKTNVFKISALHPLVCRLIGELTVYTSKSLFKSCIMELVESIQKLIGDPMNPDLMLLLLTVKSQRKKSSRHLNIPDYFDENNWDDTILSLATSDGPTLGYILDFLSSSDHLDCLTTIWNKLKERVSEKDCPMKLRVLLLNIVFHMAENANIFTTVSPKFNLLSQEVCDVVFRILSSRSLAAYCNCVCTMILLIKAEHKSDSECECDDNCLNCFDEEEGEEDETAAEEEIKVNGDENGAMEVDGLEDEESSDDSEIDESESEMKDDDLDLLKSQVKTALGAAALDEDAEEEEDEICFDDETMFRLDDSLSALFSSRKPNIDKKRESTKRVLFDAIQKRCMDSLESLLKLADNFNLFFACLLLLARLSGASLVKEGLQRKASSIITTYMKKQRSKMVALIKSDAAELDTKLNDFLESLIQVQKKSGNSAVLLECMSVIISLFGKQSNFQQCVLSVVKKNLDAFLQDRSSHLTANIFNSIFKKSPIFLWECRDNLVLLLNKPDSRSYSRVQALKFIVLLEENKSCLKNVNADDVSKFSSNVITHCVSLLSKATSCQNNHDQIADSSQKDRLQPAFIEAVLKALTSSVKLAPSNVKLLSPSFVDEFTANHPVLPKCVRHHLKLYKSVVLSLKKDSQSSSKKSKKHQKRLLESDSPAKRNRKKQKLEDDN